ncbi:MAG TPA: hemerythrin domain-containing protein [Ramlibacter sp.]|nr:hemerythrin domain-containing protein [Ramlibacter sp.]
MSDSTGAMPLRPAVAADEPIAALYAWHGRALRCCAALRRLPFHLAERGCDREAQVACHGLLRFFDNEAPQHYADEEEDLFPSMVEAMAGSDAVCIHALARGVSEQHRALAEQWRQLRPALEELAAGREVRLAHDAIETFVVQWRELVAAEEAELLPMASRLLADAQLAQITQHMRERRA